MRILMLSTDNKIFEQDSAVRQRMIEYGALAEELHIAVLSGRNFQFPISNFQTNSKIQISKNIWVYPTNSKTKFLYLFDAYKIAKLLVVSRKLSVVTAQDPFETGLLGYILKIRFKIPLQIQVHTDFLSPYFWSESIKNKIRVVLGKWLIRKADGVRVVSERIKRSLTTYNQQLTTRIAVLPIFVDVKKIRASRVTADLRQKYREHNFIILMAARLTREKNIYLAIRAMHIVAKKYPKTLLLIVGDGPELRRLQRTTNSLQLNANVKFEPWTNNLASYYKTADLFLLASNYEGYGLAAAEAMAAGLPVVMADVGLARDLVDDSNGKIFPVGDRLKLIKAVEQLIEKNAERRKLSKQAQKITGLFLTKKQHLASYKELLERVLASKKKKLCYVLPKYDPADPTHFAYIAGFIKEISRFFDIFLIIERGVRPKGDLGCRRVSVGSFENPALRLFETKMRLLWARALDYKTFYVHYSFFSAFIASFLGKTFYWNCGEPWKYKRNFLRDWFEQLVYKRVNLVTGTDGLRKQYAKHYGILLSDIRVMPNWIALEAGSQMLEAGKRKFKNRFNIKDNQKIILFVHRLSKRKGAHFLPDILERLRNKNIVMIIIGDGPERKKIELRIKNYGLYDKVRFLGEAPNRKIIEYFTLADVFIMPSEEEGFPHVLLEAMAYGVPFVVSDVGGVKDIIPKEMYNYLVKTGDTGKFTSKINYLLSKNPNSLKKLSRSLKDWVKKYDISNSVRQFRKIIS